MFDVQVAVLIVVVLVIVVGAYLLLAPAKMDPRVKALAEYAYSYAAQIMGDSAKGKVPPVKLRDNPWLRKGEITYGLYSWRGLWGKVFWDRIQVANDKSFIFQVLVHEMTHARRRRKGLPASEKIAYATRPLAIKKASEKTVTRLLDKL